MSHQVLARKWRPSSFAEMVGQEHVLRALVNALDQDRLHHAYLFTGTRGVGKTSLARLLAKCLNCEEGISSTPCGVCSSCREIAEGRSVDLIEVDAASRTKVEDTRELLDNVQYAPTRARFKIYLIDEVHMLSTHSFNALLKTLEEPPPHIKFLLATTDPQKLPVTILSRCLQFNLKNLSPERIVGHLQHVLNEEQIAFEEPALWQLGRAAAGSMRDALSLTDQAIAFGNQQINDADVSAMLGSLDQQQVFPLLEAIVEEDGKALLDHVAALAEFSPDYPAVLEELISLLHRITVEQTVPGALDNSQGDRERIQAFAEQISPADIQLYYQMALIGRRDLPLNPNLRSGLEMVLLRLLAFRPVTAAQANGAVKKKLRNSPAEAPLTSQPVVDYPESISQKPPKEEKITKLNQVIENDSLGSEKVVEKPLSEAAQPKSVESEPANLSEVETPPEVITDKSDSEFAESEKVTDSAPQDSEAKTIDQDTWVKIAPELGLKGMTHNLLMQCALVEIDVNTRGDNLIVLTIDPQYFELANPSHQARIQEAIEGWLGNKVRLEVRSGFSEAETPDAYQKRQQNEQKAHAKALLDADPQVQALVATFNATLIEDSVKLLTAKENNHET